MLQINQERASYRRSLVSISDERQTTIDVIARESVYLERAIDNLEHQFEYMNQLRKDHAKYFSNPILMLNLEESLLKSYRLRKCYDAELKKLSEVCVDN